MTRRSFKMAAIGLVSFFSFGAIAYLVISNLILVSCKVLLYMFKQPVNSIIILLSVMALVWIATMLHMLYKKN